MPEPQTPAAPERWSGHVIVCGLDGIGLRALEQLRAIGVPAVVVDDDPSAQRAALVTELGIPHIARGADLAAALTAAGLPGARAVVCADSSDLQTLEATLLVRDLRPDVRVVVHLDNPDVGRAVEQVTGQASVLDVAGLFAPTVVEQCLGHGAHELELAGVAFTTVEAHAPRPASLRELYGDLVPIGVVAAGGELIVCPGRDVRVEAGDRVTLLGTGPELAAAGLRARQGPSEAEVRRASLVSRAGRAARAVTEVADRAVRITLLVGLAVLIVSTIVLHFSYRTSTGTGMDVLQAVYFTVETAATVGFGDFSFAQQPPALQAFGIFLIVVGTAFVSTLFALVTNALVARRIEQSLGRGRLRGISGHVVMIGLGSIGMRVLDGLGARGREAVVIERDEDNRYVAQARSLGIPVVIGDATLGPILEAVSVRTASAVAIMTSDDLTNLEAGLSVRDRLGARWTDVPVIIRVFDRSLAGRLETSFDFRHVWSTSALAAPWFVGAAVGFGVVDTFYVANEPFLVARLRVEAGGGLTGLTMAELSSNIRVVGIARADSSELEHPPRRATRLGPGDEAYLVGPYEELLDVVRLNRGG